MSITPIFSGNYSNSANCSLLYFNGNNNDWSSSNNNYSARIICVVKINKIYTLQQWKHSSKWLPLKVISQKSYDCVDSNTNEFYTRLCR